MKSEGTTQYLSSPLDRQSKATTDARQGKLNSMLTLFANGTRLHRFAAEAHADHVLNTTISDLQVRHGLSFSRKWTTVKNRFGTDTRCKIYWLEGDDLAKARKVVGIAEGSI